MPAAKFPPGRPVARSPGRAGAKPPAAAGGVAQDHEFGLGSGYLYFLTESNMLLLWAYARGLLIAETPLPQTTKGIHPAPGI